MRAPFIDPSIQARQYQFRGKGHCMDPLFPEGSTAFMTQDVAPCVGDHVCVYFRDGTFADGNMKHKILTAFDDDAISLSQLNPPKTITFRRRAILAMHKIYAIQVPDGCFFGLPEGSTKARRTIEDGTVASVTTTVKRLV